MNWSDIPWKPTERTLRQFAALWLVFFSGLAYWHGYVHGRLEVAVVLAALALSVGPLGLARPHLVRPIFVGWIILAFPIGWLVSRVMLACLFYGLFTPVAVVFRLIGRDALHLRRRADATYWTPKPAAAGINAYFRQF
jgi:hypothetical protein